MQFWLPGPLESTPRPGSAPAVAERPNLSNQSLKVGSSISLHEPDGPMSCLCEIGSCLWTLKWLCSEHIVATFYQTCLDPHCTWACEGSLQAWSSKDFRRNLFSQNCFSWNVSLFSPPVRWGLLDFTSVSSPPPPPRPSSPPPLPLLPLHLVVYLLRPCDVPDLSHLVSSVWRAGPQPRACEFSVACRTPTAIPWVQCGVPDPNRDPVSSVWRAGPQPRSCEFSVACRTSTTILWVQCGVPDLNRDPVSSVWRAGPQVLCQKNCQKEWQKICQKECQKICQKKCQKDMSERYVRRYVRKNVKRYVRKNVRRYVRKNVRRYVRNNDRRYVRKNVKRYVRKNVRR